MESSKVGYWLQVGANVGILVGLVLVGLQMNQNAHLLRLQILKQDAESYVAIEMAIAGENFAEVWARVQEHPTEASLADIRVVESELWGSGVYRWINAYELYEAGLLNEADWKKIAYADLSWMFGNPYGRGWWDALSEGYPEDKTIPRELFEYVDPIIRALPLNGTSEHIESIRRHIRKYAEMDQSKD